MRTWSSHNKINEYMIVMEHTERTWVTGLILKLFNRLVPEVADDDEHRDKYPHSNDPKGWPQRPQPICT